jgi:tetratricopeptide (TPR) repeat protein
MADQEPKGLGLEGWLKRLSQQFPSNIEDEKTDPSQPLDDMAKMRWLMAIDERYMLTMPRTQTGANEKVLQDLKEIAADYQKLLAIGLPRYPFYTEEGLRTKIADVHNSAAQACEALRDYPQARQHYTAAAEIYRSLGKHEQEQRCQANLARLEFVQIGNVDDEIGRLRTKLATLPTNHEDYAETLIELAGVYSNNGDDYEAEKLLLEAEQILDKIKIGDNIGDPSGSDLAAALTQSLKSIMHPEELDQHAGALTDIERMMQINGLYRELSLALARIYETTKPQKAAHYRDKATQRDSRAHNDQFSKRMRRALEEDLGDS